MYYTILSQVGNYFLGRGSVGELLLLKIGMDSIVRRKPFHSPSSYHPYFTALSIFHFLQEECVSRHTLASIATGSLIQNIEKLTFIDFSSTYIDECTYNGAHHIAEKTIGCYLKIPSSRRSLYPLSLCHMAESRLVVSSSLTEGSIVFM